MPQQQLVFWTQPVTTDIVRPCLDDPDKLYYLRWLSPLNVWEGWLFAGDVDTKTGLDDPSSYMPGNERAPLALARPGVDTITVRAGNLTDEQFAALTTLFDAPTVYRQAPDYTLTRLFVEQNVTATRTSSDGRHELAVDIQLPRRNSITN